MTNLHYGYRTIDDVDTLSDLFLFANDWLIADQRIVDETHRSFGKLLHTFLTTCGTKSLRYLADEAEDFLTPQSGRFAPHSEMQISEARIDAKYAPTLKKAVIDFAVAFDKIAKAREKEQRDNDSRYDDAMNKAL